jgi:hypothetical protein
MKKTEKFDYLLFAGKTKDDLRPACAYKFKEDAIEAAKRLAAEKISGMKCIEVAFMPEDDDDTNEVVWSNCRRK